MLSNQNVSNKNVQYAAHRPQRQKPCPAASGMQANVLHAKGEGETEWRAAVECCGRYSETRRRRAASDDHSDAASVVSCSEGEERREGVRLGGWEGLGCAEVTAAAGSGDLGLSVCKDEKHDAGDAAERVASAGSAAWLDGSSGSSTAAAARESAPRTCGGRRCHGPEGVEPLDLRLLVWSQRRAVLGTRGAMGPGSTVLTITASALRPVPVSLHGGGESD